MARKKAIKTPRPSSPPLERDDYEESSSPNEDNTPQPQKSVEEEEEKSGAGDSDGGNSDSESGAKDSKAIAKKKRISLVPKRVRDSDLPLKKISKRTKVEGAGAVEEEEKKPIIQRIFSEEDEIALLEGMAKFDSKDMNTFYDSIKDSIRVTVTKAQLADKVRRLKKKYENLAKKSKEGKDLSFSKLHDKKSYELSKRIWGVKEADDLCLDMNPKELKKNLSDNKSDTWSGMVEFDRTEEMILKDGMSLLSAEDRVLMERKLKVIEIEAYLQRTKVIRRLAKFTLDAYTSD